MAGRHNQVTWGEFCQMSAQPWYTFGKLLGLMRAKQLTSYHRLESRWRHWEQQQSSQHPCCLVQAPYLWFQNGTEIIEWTRVILECCLECCTYVAPSHWVIRRPLWPKKMETMHCESTINPIFSGKVSLELPDSELPQVGLPSQANVDTRTHTHTCSIILQLHIIEYY